MAIVNSATLNNLRTTVRGEFNIAFKNANATSLYKRLATTIKSTSKTNTYDWLGKFPQMREWVGKRVLKDMSESSYQISNKRYEATLGVERSDIEDDNLKQPKKKREFSYEKKKPKNCTTCKVIAYSASVLDFNSVQAL